MQVGKKRDADLLARFLRTMGATAVVTGTDRSEWDVTVEAAGVDYVLRPARLSSASDAVAESEASGLTQVADRSTATVAVVRRMSDRLRSRLRDLGVSWVDEDGGGRVVVDPGLFVARDPSAAPLPASAEPTINWSRSAGAVAEALLSHRLRTDGPGRDPAASRVVPPLDAVAERAKVSTGQASRVLASFDALGWTTKTGTARGPRAQRTLDEPGALLDSWAAWHTRRTFPVLLGHALVRDTRAFVVERLVPTLPAGSWCLTGFAAASFVAPFTTSVPSIVCYVDRERLETDWTGVLDLAGLRRVGSGEAVRFVAAEPHVLVQADVGEVPTASGPRIYADLLGQLRGDEAAEHLREMLLGY